MQESHEHLDYHTAAAGDVTTKANLRIWLYFVVSGLVLFLTIGGLDILFQWELDAERKQKVGEVFSTERAKRQDFEESILSGRAGLFEDKKHLSIQEAMERFLAAQRAVQ